MIQGILGGMKTMSVQQVPQQWDDILRWVAEGEEVEMTQQDRVVARLVPASAAAPDFLTRATAVWGETPPGKPLSAIVSEDRGNAS
jgi:antitoxin (DNA-binding transcriptional repressor) of toxin-antitoxin stability system